MALRFWKHSNDSGSGFSPCDRGVKMHKAAARAFYRDKAWLDSAAESSREHRTSGARETLIYRLQHPFIESDNRTVCPKRFRRQDVANASNTLVKTLPSKIAKFQVPLSVVEEYLCLFRCRELKWMVKERLTQQMNLAKYCEEISGLFISLGSPRLT